MKLEVTSTEVERVALSSSKGPQGGGRLTGGRFEIGAVFTNRSAPLEVRCALRLPRSAIEAPVVAQWSRLDAMSDFRATYHSVTALTRVRKAPGARVGAPERRSQRDVNLPHQIPLS